MIVGKCRLCLQNKELLTESHIIPDFMYSGIFDAKHALYKIDLEEFNKSQPIYSGEYESNILCQNCDNIIFGQLENYARKIFYGGPSSHNECIKFYKEKQNDILIYCVSGVDYSKFKLFLLSILWRASISRREFFEFVSLGPYEEEIRQMIIGNNPKEEKRFPCIISHIPNVVKGSLVSQPIRNKKQGTSYSFIINEFTFIYGISGNRMPSWANEMVINRQGLLKIPEMSPETARKIMNNALGKSIF